MPRLAFYGDRDGNNREDECLTPANAHLLDKTVITGKEIG